MKLNNIFHLQMKQLFSRDSSKKSKKEKDVQPKTRTRVLKSPEHLARDDPEYRRYLFQPIIIYILINIIINKILSRGRRDMASVLYSVLQLQNYFPLERMNYFHFLALVTRQRAVLGSVTQHAMLCAVESEEQIVLVLSSLCLLIRDTNAR